MYSAGEEFERYNEEDELESFTCIANVNTDGKEYLVCDDENGDKRVFFYDSIEEEIKDLDEDEQERILEIWDNEYYGSDKDYMYWNEDFGEYDKDDNFEEKRFLRKNEATLIARYFINKGFDVSSLEPDLSFKVSRGFARYFIRPINVREIYKKNKQGNIVVNKAYFSDLLRQSHNLLFYYIDIDERLAFERAISIYVQENIGSWREFDEEGYAYSLFNHEIIQPVFDFPHTIPEESRIYPLPEKLEKMIRK